MCLEHIISDAVLAGARIPAEFPQIAKSLRSQRSAAGVSLENNDAKATVSIKDKTKDLGSNRVPLNLRVTAHDRMVHSRGNYDDETTFPDITSHDMASSAFSIHATSCMEYLDSVFSTGMNSVTLLICKYTGVAVFAATASAYFFLSDVRNRWVDIFLCNLGISFSIVMILLCSHVRVLKVPEPDDTSTLDWGMALDSLQDGLDSMRQDRDRLLDSNIQLDSEVHWLRDKINQLQGTHPKVVCLVVVSGVEEPGYV